MMGCPAGEVIEVRVDQDWGCVSQSELYAAIYPAWASPADIYTAELTGLSDKWFDERNPWQVCPYEEHVGECEEGYFYNEMACECFSMASCRMLCPEGEELHPMELCTCAETQSIQDQLYPEWVTDDYIRIANDQGVLNYNVEHGFETESNDLVRPDDWPSCEVDSDVECSACDASYFNELACQCFSFLYCPVACEPDYVIDPVTGCDCLPEEMFNALYPDWADSEDIEFAE